MFRVVLSVALIACASAYTMAPQEYRDAFAAWKAQHKKQYGSEEEETMRFAIFKYNLDYVNTHNAKGLSWTLGTNEFADLTNMEFSIGRTSGFVPRNLRRDSTAASPVSTDLPSSVDWTTKGVVTPVKNQGQCGSCWAFSTTGSVESANAIGGKGLVSLSEQQLVDCSGKYGNQGCNGGLMDQAFQYIIATGGLCSEASYPYTAQDGTCKTSCKRVHTIAKYTDVTKNQDTALETAVAKQPVSVAVDASGLDWQLYFGGVVTGDCTAQLDHGVLAVGYGTDSSSGNDYWKVKNSWGGSWGESGYIRLARGTAASSCPSGECGILASASYPSL